MTARVLEIDKTYGIELLFSWDSVPRSYWDVPLTELQSMFKREMHVWQFLTSCEGIYRYDQWTDQMIADSQACIGDNIKLSESFFGLVDWVYRRGLNFKKSNCSGAVMAKRNKLFESVPAFWDGDHTEACIAVVKRNKGMFKAQAEEQDRGASSRGG